LLAFAPIETENYWRIILFSSLAIFFLSWFWFYDSAIITVIHSHQSQFSLLSPLSSLLFLTISQRSTSR
jgi:hypothetical protein